MTVSRGREFLSIPGPTNIPDAVLAAMHRPAIDIYAGDMLAVIIRPSSGSEARNPRDRFRFAFALQRSPATGAWRCSNQRYFGPNTSMATRPAFTAQGHPA
jgi:hypothetical protein